MKYSRIVITALLFLPLPQAQAETAGSSSRSATRDSFTESPVAESPQQPETRLTKNWGGPRARLSNAGLDLAAIYKLEANRVLSGGLARETELYGNFDFRASFDFEKLGAWKGGSFFLYLLGNHGGTPSANIGDLQVTSNIETQADTLKIYEAWFQQIAFDGSVSFLFGLHDLNSEFYVTPASGLFLNSSFGVGAELANTGENGPSIFPTTAPALRLRVEPGSDFYIQTGLYGAVAGDPDEPRGTQISWKASDGFLFINEFGYQRGYEEGAPSTDLPAKVALGAWTYTVPLEQDIGVYGGYLLFERALSAEFIPFLRYGVKTNRAFELSSNLAAGFTQGAPFGRELDSLGLAFTRAGIGKAYRESLAPETLLGTQETSIELTYRAQLIPGIALQPDLQYVIHPGGDASIDNAWVGAMRLEISL